MNQGILYAIMIGVGVLMAILPYGVFMGLATLLGVGSNDPRILATFFLAAIVLTYLLSLGAFALVQKENCGSIDMKRVAANAGIAAAIQTGTLTIVGLFSSFREIITNLFPLELDPSIKDALGYSYYTFWASVFGIAVGGTLSGICAPSS